MSDIFFEELGLPRPAHVLGIHGGAHGEMTGRMMIALEDVISAEKPDAVLIYGDTNSTLAGAVVAAKLYLPIGHVEAGLRSFSPMPEEINRILADRVSRWLFCPTLTAAENLRREGLSLRGSPNRRCHVRRRNDDARPSARKIDNSRPSWCGER